MCAAFVLKSFTTLGGHTITLISLGTGDEEEFLVPYKHMCDKFSLISRVIGLSPAFRPANYATKDMIRQLRAADVCKKTTPTLLILSLDDVLRLHPDSDLVKEVSTMVEVEKENILSSSSSSSDQVEDGGVKRAREVHDFEDVVTRLLHDKYKEEYVAANSNAWREQYIAPLVQEQKDKLRRIEQFLEDMK